MKVQTAEPSLTEVYDLLTQALGALALYQRAREGNDDSEIRKVGRAIQGLARQMQRRALQIEGKGDDQ